MIFDCRYPIFVLTSAAIAAARKYLFSQQTGEGYWCGELEADTTLESDYILLNTWSTWLDPTQNPPEERPYGSKALINACKEYRYLPVFSKRTTLRKSTYDRVAARWKELGLPGRVPQVRAFEEERAVVYHEAGNFEPGG